MKTVSIWLSAISGNKFCLKMLKLSRKPLERQYTVLSVYLNRSFMYNLLQRRVYSISWQFSPLWISISEMIQLKHIQDWSPHQRVHQVEHQSSHLLFWVVVKRLLGVGGGSVQKLLPTLQQWEASPASHVGDSARMWHHMKTMDSKSGHKSGEKLLVTYKL